MSCVVMEGVGRTRVREAGVLSILGRPMDHYLYEISHGTASFFAAPGAILRMLLYPGKPVSVIDVAGGTGDIAFRLADGMRRSRVRTPVAPEIVVTDINEGMLNVGQERAKRLGYASGTCGACGAWLCAMWVGRGQGARGLVLRCAHPSLASGVLSPCHCCPRFTAPELGRW